MGVVSEEPAEIADISVYTRLVLSFLPPSVSLFINNRTVKGERTRNNNLVRMNKVFSFVFFLVSSMVYAAPLAQKEKAGPNCHSLLSRSLPECQTQLGRFGEVWGEISVDVSSPILRVTEPEKRKKKRKNKNKRKQKV